MHAASNGHLAVVELLLKAGADLSSINNQGETALLCASHQGHVAVLESLIQAGAPLNTANNRGETALMIGARRGCHDAVRLLLKKGAHPQLKNLKGQTALTMTGKDSIKKIIQTHTEACGPLFAALKDGHDISRLLNLKSLHYSDPTTGESLLMTAIRVRANFEQANDPRTAVSIKNLATLVSLLPEKGYLGNKHEILKLLLERGYRDTFKALQHKGIVDQDALNQALDKEAWKKEASPSVVEHLLKAGAQPEAKNSFGTTALMGAVVNNHPDIVRQLLANGALLNTRSADEKRNCADFDRPSTD